MRPRASTPPPGRRPSASCATARCSPSDVESPRAAHARCRCRRWSRGCSPRRPAPHRATSRRSRCRSGRARSPGCASGSSFAKGLAFAGGAPLVAVPTLEALASVADAPRATSSAPLDARKRRGLRGGLPATRRRRERARGRRRAAPARLQPGSLRGSTSGSGDPGRRCGRSVYPERFARCATGRRSPPFATHHPRGGVVARLGGAAAARAARRSRSGAARAGLRARRRTAGARRAQRGHDRQLTSRCWRKLQGTTVRRQRGGRAWRRKTRS